MNVSELIILLMDSIKDGKLKPDAKVCVGFYNKERDKTEYYIAQDVEPLEDENKAFIISL